MKRDINLIPKKQSSSGSSSKGIAITLGILLLYLIIFGVAIKIPLDLVSAVEDVSLQLDNQILTLQPQVQEYDNLVAEVAELQLKIDSKEVIAFSDRTFYNAFRLIEQTCPTGVMILDFRNTNQTIELACKAESDEQVAQFMLELDRSGEFSAIQFAGTTPSDIVMYNDFGELATIQGREFALTLVYDNSVEVEEATEESEGDA